MAVDPFAITSSPTPAPVTVSEPAPAQPGDSQVHVALTYAAIALFTALTLLFNIDWVILKQAAAQTQALALDAVVLAALPLQAVKLSNLGG